MNIVITGAAQGIGAAIATQLATANNSLFLIDLQADKLNEFAATLRDKCPHVVAAAGDLTDSQFLDRLRAYFATQTINVLINNAGVVHKLKPITELSDAELDLAYNVNIKAPFKLIQMILPNMQARGGAQILNVASRANIYGYVNMAAYAMSKAAITSLAGTVALENKQIKAVTIIPGRTNTAMQASIRGTEEATKSQSPEYVGSIVAKVISGEIEVESGNHVLIDFGEYRVMHELDKADLWRNMH